MSTDDGAIASDTISSGLAPSSAPGSPNNRIKFLCSHGGKILLRPSDGRLKYVGGETRVISVPRDISFQEMMKKLTYLIDGEMILKYQVASEDLDALVSVKCDEDVGYMRDEIERYENAGFSSRLRAFLFLAPNVMDKDNPTATASAFSVDPPLALEQCYIDAINGIARTKQHPAAVNTVQQYGLMVSSSACSSPTSPDSCTTEAVNNNNNEGTTVILQGNNYHHNGRMMNMHKVHSSPNICSMTSVNVPAQQSHIFIHQHPSSQAQQYVHHYPPGPGYLTSPKPPIDLQRGDMRLISVRSFGRAEGVRYHFDPTASAPPSQSHFFTHKQSRGVGGCCN